MGKFLRSILASCLGVLVAFFVLGVISFAFFTQMAVQADKAPKVSPNTVLHLKLNNPVPEKTNNVQFTTFEWQNQDIIGLHDILYVLEKAKDDDDIKGVFLDLSVTGLGLASARTLREAIVDFRESGKFVIAHSNFYSQGAYYLASAAESVYLNPMGMIDFRGFAAHMPFYKNMLDKLGVKMEIFYAGKFKSATEPFRREKMSDENRLQIRSYVNEIYGRFLADISESRNIPVSELRKIADNWDASSDQLSLKGGLIDGVAYEDEAYDLMREKLGLEPKEKIKVISPEKYFLAHPPKKDYKIKDKIAVIYAEGNFLGGEETPGAITEKHYVKMIRDIRKDKKVKAIVLRINSGGGNAMTSENIWRELHLAKSEDGIPLVVSMGDVAASAGYMIAAAGDSILAEENTLTGSIGVFGMMPTVQKLMNEKLGINFDTVLTGKLSAGFSPFSTFSEKEKQVMQARVNETYASFLKKVADGRGRTPEEIHEIAQGRVWTGAKAVEIGLVDRIGDLEDAIQSAADLADLNAYRVSEYPVTKDPIQQLLDQFLDLEQTKMRQKQQFIRKQLGEWYPYYEFLHEVGTTKGPQARLPFLIPFE